MEKEKVLVLVCHLKLPGEDLNRIRRLAIRQMEGGVVVLPWYVEPLLVPDGVEIRMGEIDV